MPYSGVYPVTRKPSNSEINFFLPTSNTVHTYVSGGTVKKAVVTNVGSATDVSAFSYINTSGYTTVTSSTHGLAVGDYVKLQSILVNCTSSGGI